MSYEKQTWKNGETITAEKLNHIEDGIASIGGTQSAKVKFINNGQEGTYYRVSGLVTLVDNQPTIETDGFEIDTELEIEVPLSNGYTMIDVFQFDNINDSNPPVLAGSVSFVNPGKFFITGDCSISLTGAINL